MHLSTRSALIQIMACCLDGAKPLCEPLLSYFELDPKEHFSVNEISFQIQIFSFKKKHLNMVSEKWGHFVPGRWVKANLPSGLVWYQYMGTYTADIKNDLWLTQPPGADLWETGGGRVWDNSDRRNWLNSLLTLFSSISMKMLLPYWTH